MTEIFPGRLQDFDEVKDRLRERVAVEKAGLLAKEKAKEAGDQLKTTPADFDKIAKANGLEVKTPGEFGRQDAVEGIGSAVYLEQAFKLPVGSVFGPMNIQGNDVIAKVVAKKEPDLSSLAQEREGIILAIKQRRAEERKSMLYDSILAKLIKEGKIKRHNDVIRRLTAARTS